MSDAAAAAFLGKIIWGTVELFVAVWVLVTLSRISRATRDSEAHLRKLAARSEAETERREAA